MNASLTLLAAENFKGRSWTLRPKSPVVVLRGPNRCGKSSRIEALQLALLGYVPGPWPSKLARDIYGDFGSRGRMSVVAHFSNKAEVARAYTLGQDGVVRHNGSCSFAKLPEAVLDSRVFESLSPREFLDALLLAANLTESAKAAFIGGLDLAELARSTKPINLAALASKGAWEFSSAVEESVREWKADATREAARMRKAAQAVVVLDDSAVPNLSATAEAVAEAEAALDAANRAEAQARAEKDALAKRYRNLFMTVSERRSALATLNANQPPPQQIERPDLGAAMHRAITAERALSTAMAATDHARQRHARLVEHSANAEAVRKQMQLVVEPPNPGSQEEVDAALDRASREVALAEARATVARKCASGVCPTCGQAVATDDPTASEAFAVLKRGELAEAQAKSKALKSHQEWVRRMASLKELEKVEEERSRGEGDAYEELLKAQAGEEAAKQEASASRAELEAAKKQEQQWLRVEEARRSQERARVEASAALEGLEALEAELAELVKVGKDAAAQLSNAEEATSMALAKAAKARSLHSQAQQKATGDALLAKAVEEAEKAEAEAELAGKVLKRVQAAKASMLQSAIAPVLGVANEIVRHVLGYEVAWDGTEFRLGASAAYGLTGASDSERMVVVASLTLGLAAGHPMKLCLVGRLEALDNKSKRAFAEAVCMLATTGQCSQAVMVEVSDGPTNAYAGLDVHVEELTGGKEEQR